MKIHVHVYAALREVVGSGSFEVDVGDDATVADVFDRIMELHPQSRPYRPVMRGALDDTYVPDDESVVHGAELHVITPVSGG